MSHDLYTNLFDFRASIIHPQYGNDSDFALFRDLNQPYDTRYQAFARIMNRYGFTPNSSLNGIYYFVVYPDDYKILRQWGLDINAPTVSIYNNISYLNHELIEDRPEKWIGLLREGYDLCQIGLNVPSLQAMSFLGDMIDDNGNIQMIIDPNGIDQTDDSGNISRQLVSYTNSGININQALLVLLRDIFLFDLSLIWRNIRSVIINDIYVGASTTFNGIYFQGTSQQMDLQQFKQIIQNAIISSGRRCFDDLRKYLPIVDQMLSFAGQDPVKMQLLQTIKDSIIQRMPLRPQLRQLLDRPRRGQFPGGSDYRQSEQELFPGEVQSQIQNLRPNQPEAISETLQLLNINPQQFRSPEEAIAYLRSYASQL